MSLKWPCLTADTEEFLRFVWNLLMNFKASGTISGSKNIHHLYKLLRGEALHQLATFSVELISTTTTHLNRIILGLGT